MKILMTGATGFIGKELTGRLLALGHEVRVLSRDAEAAMTTLRKSLIQAGMSPTKYDTKLHSFPWDPIREVAPATAFVGIDAVIHLAGENVGEGRWTAEKKKRILDSRRVGTRNLVEAMRGLAKKPIFISSSAVGFYGDRGEELLTESSPPGKGFLVEVCEAWEAEAEKADCSRLVILRNAVVLGTEGGALAKMLPLFKAGVGGKLGSGRQYFSWLHHEDMVELYLHALSNEKMKGIYNAAAPELVRNSTLTHELASLLHRPGIATAPAFALRMAFGQMADEALLASQKVEPTRLLAEGFRFKYPKLRDALAGALEVSRKA